MRRLLIPLCAALFYLPISAASTTHAATSSASNPQLKTFYTLQQMETVSYKAATAFYLYNVLTRDPQQYKKMQTLITSGDELTQQLGKPIVNTQWGNLKRSLTKATFTAEGVADTPSINAVNDALQTLARNLRQLGGEERKTQNFAHDKMVDMMYDQYVLLQIMTAAYLRKSADYFGGVVVASQGQQIEIDKLANQFSVQLDQLRQYYQKNPEVSKVLKEVTTKWVFIRGSLVNYNQDNVAFVIGRYNEQIADKLLSAYEKLL